MIRKFVNGILTLGVMSILIVACGEVPQAEIDQANVVINETKAAGAEIYAQEEYIALEDSMKSIMEQVEVQKTKFFGKYDEVKLQLAGLQQQASEVKTLALARKVELKQQIEANLAEVKELLAANKQLIGEAPTGKEGTAALQAITGELSAIETSVNSTSDLIAAEEYGKSADQLNAAKEKALAVNTELQEVISKYKANTKGRKG